jgi:hypothetical protein
MQTDIGTKLKGFVHLDSIELHDIRPHDLIEYRDAFYVVREYADEDNTASPIAMLNGVYTFACNQVVLDRANIVRKEKRIVSVVIGPESLMIKKLFLIYRPAA